MDIMILTTIGQTIFISMLIFYLQRKQNNSDKQKEKHEQARKEESLLLLELVMASAKLSYACAVALKRGKANGEVEEGAKAYEDAKTKYYHFLNKQAKDYLN